jgi:hypothetical protein
MAKPEIVAKVQALLARAADPGASEEERRTSGVIAAKLIREHGITFGSAPSSRSSPPSSAPLEGMTHVRLERVIGGVKSVVEVMSQGLGFDVLDFAQGLLRERVQSTLETAIKATAAPSSPRPRARGRRARAKKRAAAKPKA